MEFLDAIESQMVSNRLPLAGISIAALPCADTPLVLSLHWHGFIEHEKETEAGRQFRYESVPSSCLQVNRRWRDLRGIEHAVMDVAWELGSWDLTRLEMRPCMRPCAPTQEAIECQMAFGLALCRGGARAGIGGAGRRGIARHRRAARLPAVAVPAGARRHVGGSQRGCLARARRLPQSALPSNQLRVRRHALAARTAPRRLSIRLL